MVGTLAGPKLKSLAGFCPNWNEGGVVVVMVGEEDEVGILGISRLNPGKGLVPKTNGSGLVAFSVT
jgi:hypothetical protein